MLFFWNSKISSNPFWTSLSFVSWIFQTYHESMNLMDILEHFLRFILWFSHLNFNSALTSELLVIFVAGSTTLFLGNIISGSLMFDSFFSDLYLVGLFGFVSSLSVFVCSSTMLCRVLEWVVYVTEWTRRIYASSGDTLGAIY